MLSIFLSIIIVSCSPVDQHVCIIARIEKPFFYLQWIYLPARALHPQYAAAKQWWYVGLLRTLCCQNIIDCAENRFYLLQSPDLIKQSNLRNRTFWWDQIPFLEKVWLFFVLGSLKILLWSFFYSLKITWRPAYPGLILDPTLAGRALAGCSGKSFWRDVWVDRPLGLVTIGLGRIQQRGTIDQARSQSETIYLDRRQSETNDQSRWQLGQARPKTIDWTRWQLRDAPLLPDRGCCPPSFLKDTL